MMMTDEPTEIVEHPHGSGTKYVLALIGLLAFTALSLGMHFVPLGGIGGAVVALSIAAAKVVIVGLIFMELRESLTATRLIAVVSIAFVALLCLGILGDVAFR
jgi:caa(3)-type oxidase subunit IV